MIFTTKSKPIDVIRNLPIPHDNWFIAGGVLLSDNFSDIDIFFHTQEDFLAAVEACQNPYYSTGCAVSYSIDFYKVQFIKTRFGTPEEVTSAFDLNKSRQAQLPNGFIYQHPTFHQDLYIDTNYLGVDTIERFTKYIIVKKQPYNVQAFKDVISYLVANPTETIQNYYEPDHEYQSLTLINKLFNFQQTYLGYLFREIDKYPADYRLAIYDKIIINDSEILPVETYSLEQQLFTTLRHTDIYHSKSFANPVQISRLTPSPELAAAYPEYFI